MNERAIISQGRSCLIIFLCEVLQNSVVFKYMYISNIILQNLKI